ncbi:MAG: hypothetical protein CM1200mP29_07360 [Verrucomicrobiota bacterium]|nr:MAG: hypothetical protein CM1200mP29_07360 [Verrucomicrobiota bacterium]
MVALGQAAAARTNPSHFDRADQAATGTKMIPSLHELAATEKPRPPARVSAWPGDRCLQCAWPGPLHIAAIHNKPANIEVLLAHRANLHAKTQKEKIERSTSPAPTTAPTQSNGLSPMAVNSTPRTQRLDRCSRGGNQRPDAVLQLLHDLGKDLSTLCPDGTPLDFARSTTPTPPCNCSNAWARKKEPRCRFTWPHATEILRHSTLV